MALIKTIESDMFLITVEDAYHKINNININVSQNNIIVDVFIFSSRRARLLNARPLDYKTLNVPLNMVENNTGETFIARIYNVIKEIIFEYKDATDDLTINEEISGLTQTQIIEGPENN